MLDIWHSHCFIFRPAVEAPSLQGCLEQASALAAGTRRRVANRLHDPSIHRLVWSLLPGPGPPQGPLSGLPAPSRIPKSRTSKQRTHLRLFFRTPSSVAPLTSASHFTSGSFYRSTICFLRNCLIPNPLEGEFVIATADEESLRPAESNGLASGFLHRRRAD